MYTPLTLFLHYLFFGNCKSLLQLVQALLVSFARVLQQHRYVLFPDSNFTIGSSLLNIIWRVLIWKNLESQFWSCPVLMTFNDLLTLRKVVLKKFQFTR